MESKKLLIWLGCMLVPGIVVAQTQKVSPNVQAELNKLVKSAQAERELTFYTAVPENVAKRVGDGFTAKYGIKTQFVRVTSNALVQRYAAEAEAGNIPADFMFLTAGLSFAEQAVKKGWMEPVGQAALPVVKSGEFPSKFLTPYTAIIQVTPWLMFYNTEKVKKAEAPKDWPDLLHPRWKGQFALPDPKIADAYLDFWAVLLDKYGESFFNQLRAQNMRLYAGGTVVAQAVGAGEASVSAPTTMAIVLTTKSKGAPLETVTPEFTTGLEMHALLTARGKAKHPNAARLLANYVMSPEGNKVFNDDPGNTTIYDASGLPKQYQPSKSGLSRKEQIMKLLGL